MAESSQSTFARMDAGTVRVRKSLYSLTDQELNDLRNAFEGLYKISTAGGNDDERGYQWISGVHGLPLPIYCQHGNPNFPTWHRAYLYEFELRLQSQVPSVMLPYWDWTSQRAIQEGIPSVLSDPTYVDLKTGETKPNPLASAFCQVTGVNTRREPDDPSELQTLADQVSFALSQSNYTDFSPALENPHNGLHVWVGGNMGQVPIAAYDPLFWLHHANVDRYWFEWQEANGYPPVPDEVAQFICAPFSYTGEQTLHAREFFKYTYAQAENFAAIAQAQKPAAAVGAMPLPPSMAFDLGTVPPDFDRARLVFLKLAKTEESYRVHVHCSTGAYNAIAHTINRNNYAGTLYLFGHGPCVGGPGHCDPAPAVRGIYDRRQPHHLAPYNTYIDVTPAIREATAGGKKGVVLYFVVQDSRGNQVDPGVVQFDALSLVTEGRHPAPTGDRAPHPPPSVR